MRQMRKSTKNISAPIIFPIKTNPVLYRDFFALSFFRSFQEKTKKEEKTLDNTEIYTNFAGKLAGCRFNAKIKILTKNYDKER